MVGSTLEHPAVLLGAVHEIGGLRVGLRLVRASDGDHVRDFLERLSPETRLRRFGTPVPRVGEALVRHFTLPDGRRRFAVLATAPADRTERVIGIADVALLRSGTAEIAFVVDDDLQGRGVGRVLAGAAASLAVRRGARRLRAEVGGGGPAALALMRRLGPTMSRIEEGSSVAYTTLPVPDEWGDSLAVELGERRAS